MRLSVVLPLFNEAENLEPLYIRLSRTLERIGCDYELVFVDDASTDRSLAILERLAKHDSRVKFLSLSRNFGHEIASTAGLDAADGDAVVLMDADLQDPPELIERMLEPWLQGYDVVYGQRVCRHGESWLKRSAAYLFYRLMGRVSSLDLPLDTGDFRLMDRRVVLAFRQFSESQRFVRGIITWMGFRQTAVRYERAARHAGVGKYSFGQLLKLASDAMLGFSVLPLRLSLWLGLFCVTTSLAGAAFAVAHHWFALTDSASNALTNWCIVFFGGVQLMGIGVLGEYLGRVHRDVMRRPLYFVDRQHGCQVQQQNVPNLPGSVTARPHMARSTSARQPAA